MSVTVCCSGCQNKKSTNLLKCSGCSLAYYCNSKCQKSHWKIHKKSCIAFKVESVAGKGMGMIASRDIKQGETILKEDPVLVLDLMAPEPERHSTLLAQFNKLGDRDKRKIEALYDFDPEGDANTKIMRIFKSNSIQVGFSDTPAGLYPTVARINHSCSPNVVWSWKKGKEKFRKEVRALTNISRGQELCTNYIDDFAFNYNTSSVRRNKLLNWHFECRCSVCNLPGDQLAENDQIRREIWRHHEEISKFVDSQDINGCIASAKSKLEGLLRLGDQLISDLPSAYLEIYEFLQIAKALKLTVESPERYRKHSEELSKKFGDKFLDGYEKKMEEILHC